MAGSESLSCRGSCEPGELQAMMWRTVLAAVLALVAIPEGRLGAQEGLDPSKASLPSELLAPGAGIVVAARTSFLEGPAVDAAGDLYFSDIINNRILKMTPEGAV